MTTSSMARATPEQLRYVHDMLQEPLSGKKLMVPLTTKAFFAGQLDPEVDSGEEQILLKLSQEHLVMLDRKEASQLLAKRFNISKSVSLRKQSSSSSTEKPASSSLVSSPSVLPLFEIREEIDSEGKEVKAEAVNVVQELEYLQKKENEIIDFVRRKPEQVGSSSLDITDDYEPNPNITDDEFNKLSNRLEELARLEDEAKNKMKVNQNSAKKLQGSGWSKGFLNSKPTKAKTNTSTEQSRTNAPVKHIASDSTNSSSSKKVAFNADDKIHDIPRIGQRSVAQLKKATKHDKSPEEGPKPFESNIFSGIIQERTALQRTDFDQMQTLPKPKKRISKFSQERKEDRE